MRKAFTFLALIALLVQFTASAGQAATPGHAGAEGFAHAALHWNQSAHHHHEDGSFHEDGSEESIQHMQADSCTGAASIPTHAVSPRPGPVSTAAHDLRADPAPPAPFLEGLKRPPRSAT